MSRQSRPGLLEVFVLREQPGNRTCRHYPAAEGREQAALCELLAFLKVRQHGDPSPRRSSPCWADASALAFSATVTGQWGGVASFVHMEMWVPEIKGEKGCE